MAARNRIGLDTVLRRYCAGYSLLVYFIVEEAARALLDPAGLKQLLRAQASLFDRLLAAVSAEYVRETDTMFETAGQRRAALVERLLAGEPLDTAELGYDLDCWHLGLVVAGPGATEALRELGTKLDRALLQIDRPGSLVWAWLGGRRVFDSRDLDVLASYSWPGRAAVACGEGARGRAGWRLSHRQAAAALPVARRGTRKFVRYPEVALLATALQDDVLASFLRQAYLAPFSADRDGGAAAKDTLRAYFAAAGNISAAAAILRVNRGTVSSRLARIEERLGRPLATGSAELETALHLDRLEPLCPPEE